MRSTTGGKPRLAGLADAPFVAASVLLVAAALGLEPLVAHLGEHYRKHRILPREPLQYFEIAALPSFQPAPDTTPFIDLQPDDDVGAKDVLFLTLQERGAVGKAGQVILFITYYSDPNDRVPHTPEVCYRQINTLIRSIGETEFSVEMPDRGSEHVSARTVGIEQPGVQAMIAYLFCANGEFLTTRNQVRLALGWPGDRYVYFSKIEAIAIIAPGERPDAALDRCRRLLSEALPILLTEHFPGQADLNSG